MSSNSDKAERPDKTLKWGFIGDAVIIKDDPYDDVVTNTTRYRTNLCIMDDRFADLVKQWMLRRSRMRISDYEEL